MIEKLFQFISFEKQIFEPYISRLVYLFKTDLHKNDYLYAINGDEFNMNIKLSSNNKSMKSSIYKTKSSFSISNASYCWKLSNIVTVACI